MKDAHESVTCRCGRLFNHPRIFAPPNRAQRDDKGLRTIAITVRVPRRIYVTVARWELHPVSFFEYGAYGIKTAQTQSLIGWKLQIEINEQIRGYRQVG